jgi:hypothetical protein
MKSIDGKDVKQSTYEGGVLVDRQRRQQVRRNRQ